MSGLQGAGDPASDPGASGDPALPPLPDDFLLNDFLQVRALAQHANVIARLDAFAAAHGAVTDDDADTPSIVTGGPTASEPDFDLASDDSMPLGLRLQLAGSGNSNTILAGYVQSQAAQSLFQSSCGGGNCHSAPSAPPTPPTPYFQQEEGDGSGQSPPTSSDAGEDKGCIYCVPGSGTPSNDDYIGRTDDRDERMKDNRDGRDRTKAVIIDTYPKGDRAAGRAAEQNAINKRGGVENLDNKRNEIAPNKWPSSGVLPPSKY